MSALLGSYSGPILFGAAGAVILVLVVFAIREFSARRKQLNNRQKQRREFWGYE